MFFGKWKKPKKEAAPAPKQEPKTAAPASPPKSVAEVLLANEVQQMGTRHESPAVPLDHPLMIMSHSVPSMRHARTERDFYEGSEEPPFCYREYQNIAESRWQSSRDMPEKPLDARAELWVSGDRLEAWMAVFPPLNGGMDVMPETVDAAIEQRKIKEGRIEDAISRAKTPDGYLKLTLVAKGTPPRHGEDGRVVSLIEELDPHWKEDSNGKINFAEFNWMVNVDEGQQLCEIFPATEGEDGLDVLGKTLRGKNGKPAPKVNGKNTSYTEDGRYLKADSTGQLIRNGGKYLVNEVLTIKGDVDYSTGNIKSNNTVVVEGNVKPNFRVESKQDVIIHGTVEWATIIAGHDINVNGGITAGPDDYIQAGNDIHCRFMENGRAVCGGDAYFENLVLCDVNAEGSVLVTSGRGTVVAGSVTAMEDIRINTIGNRSYRATDIRIGMTPNFRNRLDRCTTDLKTTRENIKQTKANISKLLGKIGDPKADAALNSQKSVLNMHTLKLDNLEQKYEQLTEKVQKMKRHRIYADLAHPNVTLSIGDESTVLQHEAHYAAFLLKDHEIEMVSQ